MNQFVSEYAVPLGIFAVDLVLLLYVLRLAYLHEQEEKDHVDHEG